MRLFEKAFVGFNVGSLNIEIFAQTMLYYEIPKLSALIIYNAFVV